MRNNVSNKLATDAIRFRKTPELMLHTGRYATVSLRKTDGFVNFRYRPPENASSIFHILPCGGGIVKAKLTAPGILRVIESESRTPIDMHHLFPFHLVPSSLPSLPLYAPSLFDLTI